MNVEVLGRGMAWLDTGTQQSLLEAATYIEAIEHRQGLKVCCPEEIAYRQRFIGPAELEALADQHGRTDYGEYLRSLLSDDGQI